VTPLRAAFAEANARFHLVGFYTLAHLLQGFLARLDIEDPVVFPLALAGLLVYQGAVAGLFGLAFAAASGVTPVPRGFGRYAALLFMPLLWLAFKIGLIALGLALLAGAGVRVATGLTMDQALERTLFWCAPALGYLTQVLALYSRPLCILSRLRREHRPHLRRGWALLRANPGLSARVLGLLLATTAAGAALHYARGPGPPRADPDVTEVLLLFADCYLEMVGFFAACRVVLARFAPGGTAPLPADAAPGPPA
jgi:hypothetical protein